LIRASPVNRLLAQSAIRRMVSRRNFLVLSGVGAIGAPRTARAQGASKMRRIGFLGARARSTPSQPDVYYDAFVKGMRELGYVEGQNIAIEWRFADGHYDRLPMLAADLVRANVEVIVTHSTPGTREAQRATRTIPIVTAASLDAIASGFSTSLGKPSGNITGLTLMVMDLTPKQVELTRLMLPGLSRLALLVNPGNTAHAEFHASLRTAAQGAGIEVVPIEARSADDIARGFAQIESKGINAAVIAADSFFIGQRRLIAEAAIRSRVLSMSSYREDVEAGCLISYGQNTAEFYRRAAGYVDKLLKGAKPSDLPIEQPTNIHLAINRNTANLLGLTIPKELLLRADEVLD
jgi:putative ABC transport system substrate-binding protein